MEVKEELYKAADRIDCVDYRSAERAGEIEEALDSCVTRVGTDYSHGAICLAGLKHLNVTTFTISTLLHLLLLASSRISRYLLLKVLTLVNVKYSQRYFTKIPSWHYYTRVRHFHPNFVC